MAGFFIFEDGIVRNPNGIIQVSSSILLPTESGLVELDLSQTKPTYNIIHQGEVYKCLSFNKVAYFLNYDRLMSWDGRETREVHNFGREIRAFAMLGDGRLLTCFKDQLELYRLDQDNKLKRIQQFEAGTDLYALEADGQGRIWAWSHKSPLLEFHPDGPGLRMQRHESIAGQVLEGREMPVFVTETGPVVILGGKLYRYGGAGDSWEEGVFEPGSRDFQAGCMWTEDQRLMGWLVYWDNDIESSYIIEVDWLAGRPPELRRVPWVDLNSLGRIQQIRVRGKEVIIAGRKGLLVAERSLSESIPEPTAPVVWDVAAGLAPAQAMDFGFGEANPRFQFGAPLVSSDYPVRFQSRIKGLEEAWGRPDALAVRELGQLMAGDYQLQVRVVDPFGRTGPMASVPIHVRPHWLRSPLAVGLYVILAVLLVFAFLQGQGHYLRRRQRILKSLVRERTSELEKANRFKDDFIANLSHEIRNPLNGVIGLISELREGQPAPARNLKALKKAAHYLRSTVEEVLDFARMDSGQLRVDKRLFDIHQLAGGIIQIYRVQAEAKGLVLNDSVKVSAGTGIYSDERKIQQIIGNLTSNAVKFTRSGKVELTIRTRSEGEESLLEVEVRDTGDGISREESEKVFQKFYQAPREGPKVRGTGIGLALVKAYVDCLHGVLELDSRPGQGSVFRVLIPVELRPLTGAAAAPETVAGRAAGIPVLVVEDMEYNRIILEDKLGAMGCRVESVADGREGLELARSGRFLMVILDWDLPSLSGLEIARALRADGQVPREMVIVGMTAYATVEVQEKCLQNGMNAFLTKPLDERRLHALVEKIQGPEAGQYLSGRGLLGDMPAADGWKALKDRWRNDFLLLEEQLVDALGGSDCGRVRSVAHKLLGHLSMVRPRVLPEMLKDLQVAAMAGDIEGARLEWKELARHLPSFFEEFEHL